VTPSTSDLSPRTFFCTNSNNVPLAPRIKSTLLPQPQQLKNQSPSGSAQSLRELDQLLLATASLLPGPKSWRGSAWAWAAPLCFYASLDSNIITACTPPSNCATLTLLRMLMQGLREPLHHLLCTTSLSLYVSGSGTALSLGTTASLQQILSISWLVSSVSYDLQSPDTMWKLLNPHIRNPTTITGLSSPTCFYLQQVI